MYQEANKIYDSKIKEDDKEEEKEENEKDENKEKDQNEEINKNKEKENKEKDNNNNNKIIIIIIIIITEKIEGQIYSLTDQLASARSVNDKFKIFNKLNTKSPKCYSRMSNSNFRINWNRIKREIIKWIWKWFNFSNK